MYVLCTRVEDNLFNIDILFSFSTSKDQNIVGFIAERTYRIFSLASRLKCKNDAFSSKGPNHSRRAYATHRHLYMA